MATSSLDRLGFSTLDFEGWMEGSVILSAMVLIGIADGISLFALPFPNSAGMIIAFSSQVLIWGIPVLIFIETIVGLIRIEGASGKLVALPIAVFLNAAMGLVGSMLIILASILLT